MKHLHIIISLVIAFAGCTQRSPYDTAYVDGVVLMDGSPMQGVSVTFSPVTNSAGGNSAGGVTDISGKFTLTTGGAPVGSGALDGEYDVTFRKVEVRETTFEESLTGKQPNEIDLVPKKYGNAKTSGIAPVKVEKGGKNSFKFELKSK
ncbi:MAG: carboxypeptidase-like regulatory domain-containing protein [Planctomycetaceae bacterium]|jgi:hypothetical protein|nr:carboxypeptidase-like regulatory domain-containing protein [Planctomycetaceae bacterium]